MCGSTRLKRICDSTVLHKNKKENEICTTAIFTARNTEIQKIKSLDTDIDEIADQIQALYDDGELTSTQYDDLMGYIQDFNTDCDFTEILIKQR